MNYMITNYTVSEIEYTLYLFPFAKFKLKELERNIRDDFDYEMEYHHYLFIFRTTEQLLETCSIDEIEIINMRFFEKKSYDFKSVQLGYKNHSSVIRKLSDIIKRMSIRIHESYVNV